MPKPIILLLALTLGLGTSLLAACGSSSKGLIPSSDASQIKQDLDAIAQAANDRKCFATRQALLAASRDIGNLDASVDRKLRRRLRSGWDNLRSQALTECAKPKTTTTQTTPTVTTAPPATTQTTPPPTTTTPPPTTTTPPPTTTTPPPTTTPTSTAPPTGGTSPGGDGTTTGKGATKVEKFK